MKYSLNRDVFIRYEKDLPGDNVFIFLGYKNEMYQSNKEIYNILELIKKDITVEEMASELSKTYRDTDKSEIIYQLQNALKSLIDLEVIRVL